MSQRYDAIVIGAGLNGLTSAAYLAKAGASVLVVERREVMGGVHATEDMGEACMVDTCAHDVGWIQPEIIRELNLRANGLDLIMSGITVASPRAAGGWLVLSRDIGRTSEAIRAYCPADARVWPQFAAHTARLAGFLGRLYDQRAPRLFEQAIPDMLRLLTIGHHLRRLGKRDMIELLRTVPMPVAEYLDDALEDDTLKGILGAAAIEGICQGPRAAGTAFMLLHRHVGENAGVIRGRARVRGGSGQLAAALASAAKSHGAHIRLSAEVSAISATEDGVTGVVLANGEEIYSSLVLSGVDARSTLLRLLDPMLLEPELVRAVQNIRYRGVTAKVNLVLSEAPRFDGLPASDAAGVISISPSLDYLEKAFDDAKHGGISRAPYLEATIPSLSDDSLCRGGRHVMSVLVQYAPYRLRNGDWDDARREALGDSVVATLSAHAPGLGRSIVRRQVLTPVDMENVYGLSEGHIGHGQLALDQILFMRPVGRWAEYRMPVERLYLCGAGAHPGRGVAGGAGRLAATQVLRDLKRTAKSLKRAS